MTEKSGPNNMTEYRQDLNIVLAILAKAPVPGLAKTRLIPRLGADGAARLAHKLLARTLAAAERSGLPVTLFTEPAPTEPEWPKFSLPDTVACYPQAPGDLGARMAAAVERSLATSDGVLLSGTDCVEVSPELFGEAADALALHDAVLYPAVDGGYALLGLRAPCPAVFEAMPWSTEQVAALTLARLKAQGRSVFVGRTLHDVDEPADLARVEDLLG